MISLGLHPSQHSDAPLEARRRRQPPLALIGKWRPVMQTRHLGRHVGGHVNRLRQLRDGHLETGLHFLEDFGVLIRGGESDGEALGTEAASTADAVEV